MEFDLHTGLSLIALSFLVGFAQAGGIGGGPIISPLMMVLLNLNQRQAVWNTYVMMFGGAIGSYLKVSRERVSNSGAPLINYRLVLISTPLLMTGAIIGVAIGKSLPKFFIALLLCGVLISVIQKTSKVYKRVSAVEQKLRDSQGPKREQTWIELDYIREEYCEEQAITAYSYKQQKVGRPSLVDQQNDIRTDEIQVTSLTTDLIFRSPKLLLIYEQDKQLYPTKLIGHMFLQVMIVLFGTLIKGSPLIKSFANIEYCSLTFHACTVALLGIGLLSIRYYKEMFVQEEIEKEKLGYDFSREGSMKEMVQKTVKASLFAGILGGFVSLGGGTVLTPIWLEMGIPAPRAVASATMCILFVSFISLVQIVIIGGYTFFGFIALITSSCTGSYLVAGFLKYLVTKYQRDSIILITLMGVVAFALLILPVKTYLDISANPAEALEFNPFC